MVKNDQQISPVVLVFGTSVFVSVEHFECSLAVVIQVDAVEALEFASAGDLVVRSIFEVVFEAYGHFSTGQNAMRPSI